VEGGVFRRGGLLTVFVLSVLVRASAHAAQTVGAAMGAIDGTVTDRTGAVLPAVTIDVSGAALMGTRTEVTGPDGSYRFPALPPGEYALVFKLEGFQPASRSIRVTFGFTTTVNIPMDVAAHQVDLDVDGGVRGVDRHTTMIATNFDRRDLAYLPGSRGMNAILAATPAVQLTRFDVGGSAALAPGPFSAYGIAGYNRPTLEGISVSNMNPFGFTLDYGAFDEVSVGTGAYGPEFPSPGVHMQFITKSGGNRYDGTIYTGHENRAWQAHNIDAGQVARGAPGASGLPASEANRLDRYHDVNADAGGPVRKDRLWWYVSFRDQGAAARQVNFPIEPLETRATTTTGKGTLRLGDHHRLVAFGQGSRNRQPIRLDGFLRSASAINESVESTASQLSTGLVWKAEWNAVVGKTVFFEVRAGRFAAARSETPNGVSARFEDLFSPVVSGGNRSWQADLQRDQFFASLSYFKDGWAGSHHVKVGGDLHRLIDGEAWRQAYPGDVLHVYERGVPRQVYLFQTPSRSESGQWWYSAYASDSWRVGGGTTLNLGLRFDRLRAFLPEQGHAAGRLTPTAESFAAVNLMDWNVVAPRIGASHDLTGDGRTILKGSYGLYWLPPTAELGFNVNPNSRVWWQQYNWSDVDGNGVWGPGEEYELLDRRGGEAIETLDPRLKLAFVREVTARLEREVASDLTFATGVVWRGERQQGLRQRAAWPIEAFTIERSLRDPGPDATPGTADDGLDIRLFDLPPGVVGAPGVIVSNVPDSDMNYLTWEAAARKRLSRRWSMVAAYSQTWNRDHASAYFGQPIRANEFPVTPNDYINTDEHGRHAFHVWSAQVYGTYHAPWGLRIAPFLRHQSGQPFGRTLTTPLNYGTIRVLAEPIGTRRQDNVTLVDARLAKDFPMAAGCRVTAYVDVFNVLNANAEQNISWATGESFLRPLAIVPPRILRLGFQLEW